MKLRLLGEFELVAEDSSPRRPKARKARLLIGYLALHAPLAVDRRRMAGLLYPNADADRSLFSLRQELSTIRREIPELSPLLIAQDRETLRLRIESIDVDVLRFREQLESSPEQAVMLYRGPLLDGSNEEWVLPIRAELERRLLVALERLADQSAPRAGLRWLLRFIDIDPYCERVQQKLMCGLAESGDTAGVSVAYRKFQLLLHRELNLRPSDETTRLYLRLLREQSPLPFVASMPPRGGLPTSNTRLLGRDEDAAKVCHHLEQDRLVSLIGPGGVGKTRLAIAVGEAVAERFQAGVTFIDLSGLADSEFVPQTIGRVLGLREQPDKDWSESVIAACLGDPKLLILDNCEHLIGACAAVADRLLKGCPNLSILTTSRIACGLAAEQRYPVEPLAMPPTASSSEYTRFPAIALFVERAKRANPSFEATDVNVESIVGICRQVDGTPLGIEMAAVTLSSLSLEELANRLAQSHSFLRSKSADMPPRHRTMDAVIRSSYLLLEANDQALLRNLSVFSGVWTLEHVEGAFGDPENLAPSVLESVVRLVEASLIHMRGGGYALFETVRQFALQEQRANCEAEAARSSHLQCMIRRHRNVRKDWHGPDAATAADKYEADLDNVRAALEWSLQSGAIEDGLNLVSNAAIVMGMLGLDASVWLHRLLATKTQDPNSFGRRAALRTACWAYGAAGYGVTRGQARRRALGVAEELVSLSRDKGDSVHLAWGLCWLGQRLFPTDPDRARKTLEESLTLNAKLDDTSYESSILSFMAWIAAYRGEYADSSALVQRATVCAERNQDAQMVAGLTALQGYLAKEQCAYDEAWHTLKEAQKLFAENRSDYGARHAALVLAEICIDTGEGDALSGMATELQPRARKYADCLSTDQVAMIGRYAAALNGRWEQAGDGLGELIAGFVRRAEDWPVLEYRWAGLGMEVACMRLANDGRNPEAAKAFGGAQAMAERDAATVSPSMQSRWERLVGVAGLSGRQAQIDEGKSLGAYEAARWVEGLWP